MEEKEKEEKEEEKRRKKIFSGLQWRLRLISVDATL
jgi:hypothetical protein